MKITGHADRPGTARISYSAEQPALSMSGVRTSWMMASPGEALKLQRPLPDDALMIVARGEKKDEGGLAA